MTEPIPVLEPLIQDLKSINIEGFLKSNEFKRYCIKVNISNFWREVYDTVKAQRNFYSVGMDTEAYDSVNAFIEVLNWTYEKDEKFFYRFVSGFLSLFADWNDEKIVTTEIIEDLRLLDPPEDIIRNIQSITDHSSQSVPKSEIPIGIWNSQKLDEILDKMDKSIKSAEFNLTLTYAYSCLEGLFKAFIKEKIPEKSELTDLNQMSKVVRNYLKDHFKKNDTQYPEQMINLISTITYAISNARNSFSESHFNETSDSWLAEFARDCVNSIGRLILKFVK